jgi:hypothetical protein
MISGKADEDTKILSSELTFVELPDIFNDFDMPLD